MEKGFIKYIIIIAVIIGFVFLSQQAFSRGFGKNLISDATDQAKAYVAKGSNWVVSNVYSKIAGEVQNRGDVIKNEINKEKEKVTENILQKAENYFSGIKDSILHPGENNNCTVQPIQTTTK